MARLAIYVAILGLCSIGIHGDNPECSGEEGTKCVCKPVMKMQFEATGTPTICNNATFDWMVHTMLGEVSAQKEYILEQNELIQRHDAEYRALEDKYNEQQRISDELDEEVRFLVREKSTFQERHDAEYRALEDKYNEQNELIQRHDAEYRALEDKYNEQRRISDELDEEVRFLVQEKSTFQEEGERYQQQAEIHQQEAEKLQQEAEKLQQRYRDMQEDYDNVLWELREMKEEQERQRQEAKKAALPVDCADIQLKGSPYSGIYTIYPPNFPDGIEVFCDLTTDGGGWIVFQRRQDGSARFDQDWNAYKWGFGRLAKEFWLGNEYLHHVTNQKSYELRVDILDFDGGQGHAAYGHFLVKDEDNKYELVTGDYNGDIGDSLGHHSNHAFSTMDADHDKSRSGHCSHLYGYGGWWYVRCYDSNLNGQYIPEGGVEKTGVVWYHWKENQQTLRHVEMKIRPAGFGQK